MKKAVGVALLCIGGLVGCTASSSPPQAHYAPVMVERRAETVFTFAPKGRPGDSRLNFAASPVWHEFSLWAEKHKEKYRVISVVPAYGSCLIITVEDISPPDVPPDMQPKK